MFKPAPAAAQLRTPRTVKRPDHSQAEKPFDQALGTRRAERKARVCAIYGQESKPGGGSPSSNHPDAQSNAGRPVACYE
jgi:hypothetical protein